MFDQVNISTVNVFGLNQLLISKTDFGINVYSQQREQNHSHMQLGCAYFSAMPEFWPGVEVKVVEF